MEYSAVPFDADARASMLTVDELRAQLAASEPLDSVTFWTGQPEIQVVYGKGWHETEPAASCPVWLETTDHGWFQLTKQAALQLGSTCRVNQRFQEFTPFDILNRHVSWALHEGLGERELKLLVVGTGGEGPDGEDCPLALAQTRATVVPFSNLELLNVVLHVIRRKLGGAVADSVLIDYKRWHDLEHTSFRVVIPLVQHVIDGTGEDDDAWCYGIEVSNSLIGLKQTIINGWLFRLGTTAGITDVEHSAGGFSRRGSTPEAVYAWTAEAVGDILAGLETAFKGLQVLTERDVTFEYNSVLTQLFKESPVAKELKLRILATLEDTQGRLTMYSLAHAASAVANLEGTSWREARSLFDLAGHIVHQGGGMCDGTLPNGCRRLLDRDWEPPTAVDS